MLMSRDTLEQEVKLVVYNSKIKPVTVFYYSLKDNDIIFESKEAVICKVLLVFLIKYLCSRRFLSV